jgi:hypothetical protein
MAYDLQDFSVGEMLRCGLAIRKVTKEATFGGLLRSGDLFAVIMFTRIRVPRESADRFKSVALDVKSVLFRFQQAEVFASAMA